MRITIIIVLILHLFILTLNGQSRTITGRVISEHLEPLLEVKIQSVDTLLFGKTNIIASNGINGAESRKISNYLRQYGYGNNVKFIYMLDNDAVGIEMSKKLIEQGEEVHFMKDFCREKGLVLDGEFKDWNEVLLHCVQRES